MKYYFTYLKSLEIPTNVPSKARGGHGAPPAPPSNTSMVLDSGSLAPPPLYATGNLL